MNELEPRDSWYKNLVEIAGRPKEGRSTPLAQLHLETLKRYTDTLVQITDEQAKKLGSDGRTIKQIVGHILDWERYTIQAVEQILKGETPLIIGLKAYVDQYGIEHDFESVDDFNAFSAQVHKDRPWREVQLEAVETAVAAYALFTGVLNPEQLEETEAYEWELPTGEAIKTTAGWYLWMVTIEHEAVEHAADLYGTL